jgi:hypothetical protein
VNTAIARESGNVFRIKKGDKDIGKISFDGLEDEIGNTLLLRSELIAIFEPDILLGKEWLETVTMDVMAVRQENGFTRRVGIGKIKPQHWRNSDLSFKTLVLI